jgi:hypothetical protein
LRGAAPAKLAHEHGARQRCRARGNAEYQNGTRLKPSKRNRAAVGDGDNQCRNHDKARQEENSQFPSRPA